MLANAVSPEIHGTDTPPSRASALLHRFCVSRNFRVNPKFASADISQARRQTCRSRLAGEPGISAQTHGTDTPPSRASALLHRFGVSRHFRVNPKFASADISQARRQTCRSRLAGECGVPAQIHGTDTLPSRASALLHRICASRHFRVNPKSASADISQARRQTCRSRLAGERGVSAQIHVTDTPPWRASALLHRFCFSRKTCRSRLAG